MKKLPARSDGVAKRCQLDPVGFEFGSGGEGRVRIDFKADGFVASPVRFDEGGADPGERI